ncbi:thiolase family protein [Sphingobium estronivorans]|uniref:thiolase family protein n=1 Tax=Sphingobium estronivorans TaxID=1577690 RepID=UPI001967A550|nr:thiolase family protein [Sphingobium estronivorans]
MSASYLVGVGNTAFGRKEGSSALSLMEESSFAAIGDAGLEPGDIDGLLCGYATTMPHLMLSDVFAERMGLELSLSLTLQLGGATGAAMIALADDLIRSGRSRNILVVAGENRLTGQSRDQSIQTLAQVGDPVFEVPTGASVPAYYSLMASRYMYETGLREGDLAALCVLMRNHAARHPDAHLKEPIALADVLDSKPIATPLKLLDCCPISDGSVAFVVSGEPGGRGVRIAGSGQAHRHQHISAMKDVRETGAGHAAKAALKAAGLDLKAMDYLGIYDSFSITLAMLLEEIGVAPVGQSGAFAREGQFAQGGPTPVNLHGGLLSFGHSGVAGGMAHVAEAVRQLQGKALDRQSGQPQTALIHGDGGVMSAHVSLVLVRDR